ncbi:major facilitator superfamily domain-containing protein [Halteromyces radiatus]|uniref:major facilitator superfamily domain-containing protein n=1 Tax=Halteromyces radiatus TaxID=101107 RepID=UPI00221F0B10|nr:major facilitator superfamily domain-containing protein [Halteromyces radiatus]KAI8093140.1 major facilitator superfamily domain-containing protein [Halteromyces radiatus]
MLSPLSANIYIPALNNIQQDIGTTSELINLTVTVYMIFQGLSPAFWGSLADLWGRRPVYLLTVFVYCLSCIGLALSHVYGLLLFFRMLQAFGASSLIAVGAGVVGDIAEPAKRGSFYGSYSMGQLIGNIYNGYTMKNSFLTLFNRWIFWILLVFASICFFLTLFFVPETLRSLVGNGSGYANPTPSQWIRHRREKKLNPANAETINTTKSRFLQQPNFLAPFLYLFQLDVLIGLIYVAILYSCYYCYLVSTTNLYDKIYGLNAIQIGLCFIPQGVACVISSYISGKIMDREFTSVLNKYKQDHPGAIIDRGKIPLDFPIYHARFRISWIYAVAIQIVTLGYGWALQNSVHLAVPIILQFIVAFCMVGSMNAMQTLLVDLFPGRGASITASNNLVRCILGAVITVCIDPGIQGVGVGWFFTVSGKQ